MSQDLLLGTLVALVFFSLLAELMLRLLNLYSLEKWRTDPEDRSYQYQRAIQMLGLQNSALMGLSFLIFLALRLPAHLYEGLSSISFGYSILADLLFVTALLVGKFLLQLPWSIYRRFVIEEHFGFNRMTPRDFVKDLAKSSLLGLILGLPLLLGLFWLMENLQWWWLWGFLGLTAYQILLMWLYPIFIAPLFNRFTALEPGQLKQRLEELLSQCDFTIKGLFVMDGSKRSKHSNAYFTGFGKNRRIVLFDTLIKDLQQEQLAAVLAHEVGHYKKRHIPKMILQNLCGLLLSFLGLYLLAQWQGLFESFGFAGQPSPAVLLFLGSCIPFGLVSQYLSNLFSRKHEFEADAYAVQVMGEKQSIREALLSLHRENLSNPAPHPLYTAFYYTHPSLEERLAAL